MKNLISNTIKESFKNIESKYFTNINFKTEDAFDLIDYSDSYINLYQNYDEYDNEYEDEYYFKSKQDAYKNVNQILEFFDSLPNPILIYRSIKVKSVKDIDLENLGESWSFDKHSAINFANNHARGNFLLIAKTKFDNVNWKNTIKLYFEFSNSYDGNDENEINIIDSDALFDITTQKI